MQARHRLPSPLPTASLAGPPDEFPDRVRAGLRSLLANDAVLERTALKIQARQPADWNFTKESCFFDFESKVDHVVAHFAPDGLTKPAYLLAATRSTPLFYLSPETLIRNVERVLEHFRDDGLRRAAYVRAALRQPQLFYQKPETIIRTVGLIMGLHARGLMDLPEGPGPGPTERAALLEFLVKRPPLFGLSTSNIALRESYARLFHTRSANKLLRTPRHHIERELEERLGPDKAQSNTTVSTLISTTAAQSALCAQPIG
jgi:hypothetical protein